MLKKQKGLVLPVALFVLSACAGADVEYKYPEKVKGKYEMPSASTTVEKNDTVFNKEYLTFTIGGEKENSVQQAKVQEKMPEPVQKQEKRTAFSPTADLWPGVLPVLSQYPIEIAQEKFVSTEWFSDPENKSRQLKINVVQAGEDVKITVLCREKDKKGDWINQKNDAKLADKIKNDIVKQTINH